MQFSTLFIAAALSALAAAKVNFTNTAFAGIVAGEPFTITWTGATAPVTLKLKGGDPAAQTLVDTIATGLTGNSFTWTPPITTPDETYNFEIDAGTDINYSTRFEITGGTGTTSVSSSAASTTDSASATSTTLTSETSSASTTTSASTSNTSSSHTSSKTSASSTAASSTSSAASVPTSNSAIKNGSPFALVVVGALAIAGLN